MIQLKEMYLNCKLKIDAVILQNFHEMFIRTLLKIKSSEVEQQY
jgi:hypothetical protein